MRVIVAAIWAFLLSALVTYVLSNMAGEPFELSSVLVLTVLFLVAVIGLGEGALREKSE
ncbi:YjzD family protein [Radiobacillus kanasensis]|uniref:DUF2929 family protein n=1 Tax=Radiobacillus kanasensis TaxID=2844358 RepID=UPI001E30230E|nr:DUF2929 family protein [Radiobacillus kanasensis]UFU00556.1 YjzD family protein [Radiobacillus kanasensis]